MPLLFAMSLFGSIGTLVYFLLLPLSRKYLSVKWRRYYLICNIMEYLIPFPYCHVMYKELLKAMWRREPSYSPAEKTLFTDYTENVIQIAPGEIYIPNAAVYVLAAVIVIISMWILWCWFQKYKRIKYFLRTNAEPVADQVYNGMIQEFSSANKKVLQVYQCGAADTPFTIGIFCPIIVLPLREWDVTELKMVMEHETIHIRQWDNPIKILVLVLLALNFYNPLAWYVMYQWNVAAELSCDQKVITGKTKEEIKRYGLLTVEMGENHIGNMNMPIMGFSMQNKIMKERIDQMRNGVKKERVLQKFIGAGVMGIALFASTLSVFAYSPKSITYANDIYDTTYFSEDVMWGDVYGDLPVNKNGGWIFWSEETDNIEILSELNPDIEMYSLCIHEYVSGETTGHIKNSDNSCKVDYYNAKRCSKCGKVVLGELISTSMYTLCPH
ncbi:MAG: M56 family metallopeptidase [Lachnospiraceae bacterium]|nr:M56 family metallopeptidase [Lachnospiraceae bacterium]